MPYLDPYAFRTPWLIKPELIGFEFQNNGSEKMDNNYEDIIQKLCDILKIMDDKDFQKQIDENQKLQDLYGTITDTTNRFEKLQRDTKLQKRNKELIDECVDIECNYIRKTNTNYLSGLINEYRGTNKLDMEDNIENLVKAINVEAGELLETTNFGKVIDPKKVEEELADVLIYCFSLANELTTPVDRIIARKIKKNIERGRKYE